MSCSSLVEPFRPSIGCKDQEGEVLEVVVTKRRDKKAALRTLKSLIKRRGRPMAIVPDKLRSYKNWVAKTSKKPEVD